VIVANVGISEEQLLKWYALDYDKIINGIFQLKGLLAPLTTEFNVIKLVDTSTSQVTNIGILLRSPEPFNDPKMSDIDLASTISITDPSSSSNYLKIFSKDRTNVFITNASNNLTSGDYYFDFKLMKFNGASYSMIDSVNQVKISII
jgi:hypothetical protein